MTLIQSYHSKETSISALYAEKIAEVVLLYGRENENTETFQFVFKKFYRHDRLLAVKSSRALIYMSYLENGDIESGPHP